MNSLPIVIGGGAAAIVALILLATHGSDLTPTGVKKVQTASKNMPFLRPILEKWARQFSVPLPMVMTICHIETDFNPTLSNNSPNAMKLGGAWGLMEVTQQTATSLVAKIKAAKLDQTVPAVKAALAKWTGQGPSLLDPDLNALLGCFMLSGLWVKYKGDPLKVAAAYHSGSGTVDKLLASNTFPAGLGPAGREYVARTTNLFPTYNIG